MSGSGGGGHNDSSGGSSSIAGGGGSGSGSGGSGDDACDINETAPVNSPQPGVVRTLSVGDHMDVALTGTAPRQVLQLIAPAGVAGSLTHRGALAISRCINAGHSYDAEVLSISGGQIIVRITRV